MNKCVASTIGCLVEAQKDYTSYNNSYKNYSKLLFIRKCMVLNQTLELE